MQAILELSEDPFHPAPFPCAATQACTCIRAYRDQYRIVYRVSETQERVIVERVRARSTAYRGL